ncbi:transketolase [Georgenia satyanarayanai]|uniref:Transketolase n=1 Tax=Georgenia satyanarayanai TaxID=860221 RepID=A0A2Y8ZY86_9MICO|nr:transketolase [Georgenia satyanarayanai]PYG02153.1 transketolase [Georgenia satyanarayanai]SSA36965.1 transketolase [Georgenia satyanarayanai]
MSETSTQAGWTDLDRRAVDTARVLAADAVEKVGSGHPGTAMSLAPAAYLLYQNVMRHDPADPHWVGRDRFVLSAGHSALTQYIQLYLSGYGLELEDLKALRTWGSKTPGHPEYRHTEGVEVTTGPLGQGLANGVGMAMAARRERGLLDPDAAAGTSPFDHHVYVIASDGDLQEGVTSEASAIAGVQELGNLVVIWDDNRISIEDDTNIAFTEDVLARYAAYGWHTERVDWTDGGTGYTEDVDALASAIAAGKAETNRPTIIALRTIIGWPAPTKQNTGAIHGSALGGDEVRGLKEILGFDPEQTFEVSDEVITHVRQVRDRGAAARAEWDTAYQAWRTANPDGAALLDRLSARELPEGWTDALPTFEEGKAVSTRSASGSVLSALAPVLPELWGGSADLAGSNNTTMKGEPSFLPVERSTKMFPGNPYGRTLHFGIREHAMGSILNGITLHGLTRPYGGTFLTFSDYMRPPVRLAALMGVPSTFVWTHDSIGLGEDGPTHQPIEHLAALRAIPGLDVVRPGDAAEVTVAWRTILENTERPAGLVLTRQNVPNPARGTGAAEGDTLASAEGVARGAYVLAEATGGTPQVILIATGSEVQVALAAREALQADGVATRVVSMPCREWFALQDDAYQEEVLPGSVKARVSVEAAIAQGWHEIVGDAGRCVSIEHYGASAAYERLYEEFGITAEATVAKARESLAAAGQDSPGTDQDAAPGGTGDLPK